ncbi:prokineticin-1 isoform X1 [Lepidochelys kempii]|uniref:prokineticin-1 isoform X1 n=1 Tax=Lepidochelys kempii TaxID=8472 RepID=UPI003C6F57B7
MISWQGRTDGPVDRALVWDVGDLGPVYFISDSLWACERDLQCGAGTCCAISLWLRGLRMCTPLGQEGDECHPFSHKVPFLGKRQHHTCPCLPNFICSRFIDGRFRCSVDFKNIDF